jgi:tetratricopeptide (TPR) repeat protein
MPLTKIFPLVASSLLLVAVCTGCVQQKTAPLQDTTIANPSGVEEEADHGCSYFYFLWGRHAELAGKNEEALEAYEKAIICDPKADPAIRKIPLLLVRLGRMEEAVAKLEQYIDEHPDRSGPRMLLAKILIRRGKLEEAAAQYRKVAARAPDDSTPLLLLSELYLNRNKPELARDTLEEVLRIDPASYPGRVLLARLLVMGGEYDKAVEEYRDALKINWSAELQLEMAEVLLQQKKYSAAIGLYRDILERDEFDEDARIALIHAYLVQKNEDQALVELNRLKAITNRPERVDLTIARLFARRQEYAKAIDILENVLKESDSSEVRYLLAVLFFQTEKYDAALQVLGKINRDAEEYDDAILLQVRTLRRLKRDDDAIELLEAAIQDEKLRNPDMYVLLAALYQLSKREDLGRQTFVRAIKTYPDNDQLLYEYGLFLDNQGQQEKAMDVMQQVIKLQPEHAAALNYVGYTWADKKIHLDKAFEYIKRAVELKPDNGYIRDSLGWVYYRQGKLDKAVKTLEEAARLSPRDPAILDHLGDVYLEAGRTDDALKTYKKARDLYRDDEGRKQVEKKIRLLERQENK